MAAAQSRFYVAPNGVKIHFLEYGTDGPDVLLIPGITTPAILWGFVCERIGRYAHVVALDNRGRGLSDQRPGGLPPLQVCLQVNISGEVSKSGVTPAAVLPLAQAVNALPRLSLRGLMSIPEPASDEAARRAPHRALRELRDALQAADPRLHLPVLSMGMSDDLEAAIAEGATLVRVGTAIFGRRT